MSPLDLPPELRARLRGLAIVPRRAATIGHAGAHASRNRGGGMEFAQYRAYEQGDEPRLIDWKLYARSDRFFVRDAERESPVALHIVLDASASMDQADLARPGWRRFDAALRIAACLIELALRQGDRFGLIVTGGSEPMLIPLGSGPRHRDRLLLALARCRPEGTADWAGMLPRIGKRIGAADVAVVLTDGFDEDCVAGVERLARSGRDMAMVQLITADERDFPFDGGYRFHDAETGAAVIGDGVALRADYLARFAEARTALAARLGAAGIRQAEHFIDEREDLPLRRLFGRVAAR